MLKTLPKLFFFFFLFSTAHHAISQVVAGFTLSDTTGCAPLVDHFTNTSTGATSYTWDLGNGTTSTLTNVSGSYLAAGTYTVTLTAHNGLSSSTHHATINVYGLPTVHFTASDTTLCPGIPTVFTSTSVAGAPGPMTYSWNFGDGATSTVTSPSHAYLAPGSYNATLFVTNGKGCINSLSRAPYIHVYTPPSVGFSAASTYICRSPGIATFSNSTIGFGSMTYLWRFGDGTTSSALAPSHHYMSAGVYTVSLTGTDGNGCLDSLYNPSYITVGGLSASYTPVSNACINSPVNFTNTSTSHLLSGWDFGDGTTALTEDGVHTYTATGTYPVRLIIYDGTCFDTIIHSITISHPSGSFTISPAQACPPPITLTFNASVSPGSTVSWSSLDFGYLGTGTTLSHSFPKITVYPPSAPPDYVGFIDSVTMIVTDVNGCKDTVGKLDTVNDLRLDVTPDAVDTCTPVTAHLAAVLRSVVYDPFAGYPFYAFGYPPPIDVSFPYPYGVASYSWNFGDGSPLSATPSPTHVYTLVGGVYNVGVSVVTSNGCNASITKMAKVKVGAPPPTPSFTRTPSRLCAGGYVSCFSSTSGVFDAYVWSFGDGGTSTFSSPSHQYTVPGIYTIEFRTSYNGCRSLDYMQKDTVDSPGAVVYATLNCNPRTKVTFVDTSAGSNSRLWQFGDGATSTAGTVTHTYPTVSTYVVTLSTYNSSSGCRDTTHYSLDLIPLTASMSALSGSICRDVRDTFVAAAVGTTDGYTMVTKYRWFFSGALTDSFVSSYPWDTLRTHSFHSTGINTPMLVLTDNHGCLDTLTTPVLVAKPADSFNFTPASGCSPLAVTFTDHSTPASGTSLAGYKWTFGDGYSLASVSPVAMHSYGLDGSYPVTEIVTDNLGCADTFTSATSVVVHRPTAGFHAGVPTVCAHRSVTFYNVSTGYTSSMWFFGDGDTSTATSPTHIYHTAGLYSPKLVLTGAFGCTDTMIIPGYINVNPVPAASFLMSDSFAVCSPFSVAFTNTSAGSTYCFWTFGDGTTSAATSPTDVYIAPGYYRVKLEAFNSYACMDTAIGHVNLFGYSGAFTYAPLTGCMALPVHFTGGFTSVAHVIWDFSDGVTSSPSTLDTISHTYMSPGMYIPKLILTDSFGCTSSSVGSDTIRVGTMSAGFTVTPNPVCQHDTVVFHDTSNGGVLPVTGWLWTFAPGVTSTLSSPAHVYSLAGTYTVSLTVTTGGGCTGYATRTVTVVSTPPAIAGPSIVCISGPSHFTDAVTGGVWSTGSPGVISVGSSSGWVTGVSLGVATLTYSIGSGCTVTKVVTVNTGPSPVIGPASMCPGATVTLTDASPSGVWSASNTTVAIVGSTGIVSGITPGTDTILYTVGSCAAEKVVTVSPLPAPITGSAHICLGTTSTLGSSPAGGTWSSASPLVASVGSASGVVSGLSLGSSVITYTPLTGCRGTATVSVTPPPTSITGASFVCIGGSVSLTDTLTGGTWTSANSSVATVGSVSGIVTGGSLGSAVISYNYGGCFATKIISVNPLPPAITGPGSVCIASTVIYSDASVGGLWSSSNSFIAMVGSASGAVTGLAAGMVTITYSLGGGCTVITPVSINPLPPGISGTPNLCPGSTAMFTDPSPGGTWSSTAPSVATISSAGLVTGLSGGLDTIHYTVLSGCAATYMVSVVVVPPISGLSNLCAFVDTATIYDSDTTGSYSSTLATVTNLGGGFGLVTAYAAGLAVIHYTVPAGCSTTSTVTINPLPGGITGITNLCLGGTATLHDTSSGGHWSASGTGVVTIGSSSGLVTGVSAGVGRVTYTIATGCEADVAVTVNTMPTADSISGPSYLCAGQVITLSDSVAGGTWASGSTAIVSVSAGVVTGLSAGSSVISYTVTNPCGSALMVKPIVVYPAISAGSILGADTVCVNSTITLTDAVPGGAWTISDPAVASLSGGAIVTGLAAGTDTVFYTVTNPSCSATAKHAFVVRPLPVTPVITGNGNLCTGDSALLTVNVPGGSWNQVFHIIGLSPVPGGVSVHALLAGTDTVYYIVTGDCGTTGATFGINVGAPPLVSPIQGLSGFCAGQQITLTDATAGGVWAAAKPSVASVGGASGIVTGIMAGVDTIFYTVANACGTVGVNGTVTVNPLPVAGAIAGIADMCVGDSVTLADSVAGGTWSMAGNTAAISGSVVVTGLSVGTDMLSYSVSNNCGTAVATQSITVEPLPAGITISRNDHVLSVPAGYASYQWLLNGKPIPGATGSSYTFPGVGNYSVIVDNSFGCSFTTPVLDITDCAVSDIHVYPNPTSSLIYISWCNKVTAKMCADDGRLIEIVDNATQLDVSLLPNAIYTLTLFDAGGHKLLTKRITKLSK